MNEAENKNGLTLVLGGTGKTGRRVVKHLRTKGVPVRIGSRLATPSFDWKNELGWEACLEDVESVYLNYAPDLAVPGARDSIQAFVDLARRKGVKNVVLISGRGEEEARACETIVQKSGLTWTIVRAGWFNQNFSEGAFSDMVLAGELTLPGGELQEPWVDVDDIAEVVAVCLTEPGHSGEVYELTGPRLLTFADIALELSQATGRNIAYIDVPHAAFIEGIAESGAPKDVVWLMDYLFATVLDGRNAYLCDGVQRALGRPARDFRQYAAQAVADSAWKAAPVGIT